MEKFISILNVGMILGTLSVANSSNINNVFYRLVDKDRYPPDEILTVFENVRSSTECGVFHQQAPSFFYNAVSKKCVSTGKTGSLPLLTVSGFDHYEVSYTDSNNPQPTILPPISSSESTVLVTSEIPLPSESTVLTTSETSSPSESTVLTTSETSSPSESTVLVTSETSSPSESTVLMTSEISSPSESTVLITSETPSPSESTVLITSEISSPSESTVLITSEASSPSESTVLITSEISSLSESTVLMTSEIPSPSESTVLMTSEISSPSKSTVPMTSETSTKMQTEVSTYSDINTTTGDVVISDPTTTTGSDAGTTVTGAKFETCNYSNLGHSNSWFDAQTNCKSTGGFLLELQSTQEADFVLTNIIKGIKKMSILVRYTSAVVTLVRALCG
ncbi:mucin-17-like isoform X2 [Ostrea edulis]|uniref:mucin-17-like isoform X2 n=1 Tax=Ostrea edulis TaxID=37623 RepID=UPI0024AF87F6|nr:mucin-17-like isoform X2 [Ostrea edulis]